MGLERFLTKRSERPEEGEEKIDTGRRKAFIGLAAFAAAAALPKESLASDLPELEFLSTLEERKLNVEKIYRYATWLKVKEKDLANAKTAEEIEEIMFHEVPALGEEVLEGTELDVRNFIGEKGWPATLLTYKNSEGKEKRANSFTVKGRAIANPHVFKNYEDCTVDKDGLEIAGCPLSNTSVVPDEETKRRREESALGFDEDQAGRNLHGEIVFIPAMRKEGGKEVYELLPAALMKVTSNFFYDGDNSRRTFFNENNTRLYRNQLEHSYIALVAPKDHNRDTRRDGRDIEGMSGSPLITLEDCRDKKRNASGIQWGAIPRTDRTDPDKPVTRSLVLVFGPDVLGNFLKQMDGGVESQSREIVTKKIQEQLSVWRRAEGLPPITVDGIYGKETQEAVFQFQQAKFGLEYPDETGFVNEETWQLLFPGEPYVDVFEIV